MSEVDNTVAAPIPQEIPAAGRDIDALGKSLLDTKARLVRTTALQEAASASASKLAAERDRIHAEVQKAEQNYTAALRSIPLTIES